jgi:hypothetical protein
MPRCCNGPCSEQGVLTTGFGNYWVKCLYKKRTDQVERGIRLVDNRADRVHARAAVVPVWRGVERLRVRVGPSPRGSGRWRLKHSAEN